jgi:predicted nucleotide-binding protein (sugar kinase/HSP70/actin superfamily)
LASPLLDDRHEPSVEDTVAAGQRWVPEEFVGETILTIGRSIEFMKNGADLVVNAAPFGCMPGALTSGVLQAVEVEHGVPVASMFYDGEGGGVNDRLTTYIANLASTSGAARAK